LEEMSGTGGIAGIQTPNWGTKNSDGSPGAIKSLRSLGFKPVKSITEDPDAINEVRSRYKRFKTYPAKESFKISLSIQEINKMIREVDFLISINDRFKEEHDVPSESLWKRTEARVAEIRARLKSINEKLKRIYK